MKTNKTSRKLALKWWSSINGTIKQKELGNKYCENRVFSIKYIPLTGREIEEIWKKEHPNLVTSTKQLDVITDEVFEDCFKCNQTIQNCECHIPFEEKHASLFKMKEVIPQLLKELKPNQKQMFSREEVISLLHKFMQYQHPDWHHWSTVKWAEQNLK